ncbi:universal stress protein [Streptomyces sp. PCS3-D2]|uniref:universal stress protein n=1 Tax=Streptomyces sp. PCS3-D2 TaxID=1460244 RepID=UPI00044A4755|nr:universal stress protein [Streptomyces sp. PCS3-D2]WKV70721.1 universal stress protein [Streptomyces sp. PCS3-D2]
MLRTVIAAVDGSAASLAAAEWAAREARMRRLPLHVVHVLQDWSQQFAHAPYAGVNTLPDGGSTAGQQWARRLPHDASDRLRERHPGLEIPVVEGYDPGAADPGHGVALGLREAGVLTDVLRSWRGMFPQVEVKEQCMVGRPAGHLVEASEDASLLVVGRRIRRAAVGAHIGPVTHAVLHHARTPVAVVPHL